MLERSVTNNERVIRNSLITWKILLMKIISNFMKRTNKIECNSNAQELFLKSIIKNQSGF